MIHSSFTEKYLELHQFQGQSNDCGPYCTATLLNLILNTQIQGETLAQEMNKISWKGPFLLIKRIKNWATFPWGIVEEFKIKGVPARWSPFTNPDSLYANLVRNSHTIIIIGELKPKAWAHYLILTAQDHEKGWGFVNSAKPAAEIDWIPSAQFDQQWNAYGRISIIVG